MRPGVLLSQFRRLYQGGVKASWYREIVRPRILRTPSILLPDQSEYEIHALTSIDDWQNLLWGLKSFYHFSEQLPALCIHEDGTLTPEVREILKTHFVGARLMTREQSDREVLETLGDYPACQKFRTESKLSIKLFNLMYYARSSRVLLVDSDVLFFEQPVALLDALADESTPNRFNRDVQDAYTCERQQLADEFGLDVPPRFNSGLCVLQVESLNLDDIEQYLSSELLDGHFWRIEQTLICLCSAKYGTSPLPEGYDVILEDGLTNKPVKHYTSAIRNRMYAEGMRHLFQHNFIQALHTAPHPELAGGTTR